VCSKCREKAQWRFKYDKYRPLRTPASCRDCKGKTVYKVRLKYLRVMASYYCMVYSLSGYVHSRLSYDSDSLYRA
jgi:hypothetical protein